MSDSSVLPYSSAVKAGNYIFVSGQVGIWNPETGEEIKGIEGQCRQCLENMKRILDTAGLSLNDVVKVTVYLLSAEDFAAMNKVYTSYFSTDRPTRSTVVSGLVIPGALIEMDCIGYCTSEQDKPRH